MSLVNHIRAERLKLEEDDKRREENLRSEKKFRKEEQEKQFYREIQELADEIGDRTHIVYVGHGFDPDQRNYTTRARDWVYSSGGYRSSGGDWQGGSGHFVGPSVAYKGERTSGLQKITKDKIKWFRLEVHEIVVGYYLTEWDISIKMDLIADANDYRFLQFTYEEGFANRFFPDYLLHQFQSKRNDYAIRDIARRYMGLYAWNPDGQDWLTSLMRKKFT